MRRPEQMRWSQGATTSSATPRSASRTIRSDLTGLSIPYTSARCPAGFWSRVPYLDPGDGDHKIIWESNRHQHWLALGRAAWLTGESRYALAVARELRSWLDANPPLTGVNWASMLELRFRCISSIWALHFLAPAAELDGAGWAPDLSSRSIANSNTFRVTCRSTSARTRTCSVKRSRWTSAAACCGICEDRIDGRGGREILIAETRRQVLPDGGHAERSPHYHRCSTSTCWHCA